MIRIDYSKCINCKRCYDRCAEGLYDLDENGKVYVARPDECWLCGTCEMDCPVGAIKVTLPPKKEYMVVKQELLHDVRTQEEKDSLKKKYQDIEKELVADKISGEGW